jgi:hypothetical protein
MEQKNNDKLRELQTYAKFLFEIKNSIMFVLTHQDMSYESKNYFINIYNSILDDIDKQMMLINNHIDSNKKQKLNK